MQKQIERKEDNGVENRKRKRKIDRPTVIAGQILTKKNYANTEIKKSGKRGEKRKHYRDKLKDRQRGIPNRQRGLIVRENN